MTRRAYNRLIGTILALGARDLRAAARRRRVELPYPAAGTLSASSSRSSAADGCRSTKARASSTGIAPLTTASWRTSPSATYATANRARVRISEDDRLVPCRRPTHDVEELAGDLAEDPRRPLCRDRLAEHRQRRALAALSRRVPMLDSAPRDPRDVARGPRRGVARPLLAVGHDPVVDGQPGRLRQLGSRNDTDAGDAEGVVDAAPRRPSAAPFVEPRDGGSEADLDARASQPLPGPRVELVAERPRPQPLAHLEDRRAQPECGEAGGDLDADEAAADDRHPRPGSGPDGPRAKGTRIRQACAATAPLTALDVQLTGPRAGRDQAALEPDPVPSSSVASRASRSSADHPHARDGAPLPCARTNARARPGRGRREGRPGGAPCSAAGGCRAGLARRRPADPAVESLPAQRPGAADRGDPAADEQDLDRRACLSHDGILVVTLR